MSIEDFVTDLNLHEIKASLDSSPVVSSLNVENVSSSGTNSLIGDFNVEKVSGISIDSSFHIYIHQRDNWCYVRLCWVIFVVNLKRLL